MGFAVASEAIARVIADRNFILSDVNDAVKESSLFLNERYYATVRDSEGGDESGFLSIFSSSWDLPSGFIEVLQAVTHPSSEYTTDGWFCQDVL